MNTREDLILETLRARLAAIPGMQQALIEPPDAHADKAPYPRVGLYPRKTKRVGKQQTQKLLARMSIEIRGLTQAQPGEPAEGDVPVNNRTVGSELWASMCAALFPVPAARYGSDQDRVNGAAYLLEYDGHEIYPCSDSGEMYAVYVDVHVDYPLTLNQPAQ